MFQKKILYIGMVAVCVCVVFVVLITIAGGKGVPDNSVSVSNREFTQFLKGGGRGNNKIGLLRERRVVDGGEVVGGVRGG